MVCEAARSSPVGPHFCPLCHNVCGFVIYMLMDIKVRDLYIYIYKTIIFACIEVQEYLQLICLCLDFYTLINVTTTSLQYLFLTNNSHITQSALWQKVYILLCLDN